MLTHNIPYICPRHVATISPTFFTLISLNFKIYYYQTCCLRLSWGNLTLVPLHPGIPWGPGAPSWPGIPFEKGYSTYIIFLLDYFLRNFQLRSQILLTGRPGVPGNPGSPGGPYNKK